MEPADDCWSDYMGMTWGQWKPIKERLDREFNHYCEGKEIFAQYARSRNLSNLYPGNDFKAFSKWCDLEKVFEWFYNSNSNTAYARMDDYLNIQ